MSYTELASAIDAMASCLRTSGVREGDPVVMAITNSLEFIVIFLALVREKAIAVPVNPELSADEICFVLQDANARALMANVDYGNAVTAAARAGIPLFETGDEGGGSPAITTRRLPSRTKSTGDVPANSDVRLMLYTSGTTGSPKGVPLTERNLIAAVKHFSQSFQLSHSDCALLVMPLFHVHGLIGVTLSTLYTGGQLLVAPRFHASRLWQWIRDYQVTWYSGSPTIHQIMLAREDRIDPRELKLRFVRSSSARLAPNLISRFEERFGTTLIEAYGMTEAANQISSNPLPPGVRKAGSVGTACGTEVSILDDQGNPLARNQRGEICLRGDNIFSGYHHREAVNTRSFSNGWFRTGDQGYLDSDGYLYLTGRLKEIIIRGGENISPLEIDLVLLSHPHVTDAVCFALPHEKYGEEVYAAVVLSGGLTESQLIQFCREHLAEFKLPKKIFFMNQLPRTATNKVQRQFIASLFLSHS